MSRSALVLLAAACALCLVACDPHEEGDCVIEETGYLQPCVLDSELVAWTSLESRIQAVGQPSSAPSAHALRLHNTATDASVEVLSSDSGSFVVELAGGVGDGFVLSAVGLPEAGEVSWEARDLPPFPATQTILATPDPSTDAHRVVVEVVFETAQTGGHVWVANQANDAASYLHVFQDGAIHGGHLAGTVGNRLLLFWYGPGDAVHSAAVEVEVAPL